MKSMFTLDRFIPGKRTHSAFEGRGIKKVSTNFSAARSQSILFSQGGLEAEKPVIPGVHYSVLIVILQLTQ